MEKVVHKIRLDLGKMGSQASICVSQGDVKSRRIMFLLYNGAIPYEVTDNLRITFSAVKPDGTMLYDDSSFIISGNVITYLMHEQLTAVVGTVNCELVITDSTGILYSPQFDVYVQDVLITASDITSTSEFTQLNRLLNSWENPVTNVSYGDDVNASVNLDAENGQVNFDFKLEKLPVNNAPGQVLTVDEYGTKLWTSDALTITVNAVVDGDTGDIEASTVLDLEWGELSGNFPQIAAQALEMKRPVYALLKGVANNRTLVLPLTNVYVNSYAEFSGVLYMANIAYKAYVEIDQHGYATVVRFETIADADTKLKIVTISGNDTDGYTADMTQSEIQSAVRSGSYVIARLEKYDIHTWAIIDGFITGGSDGYTHFRRIHPSGDSFVIDTFTIYGSTVTREIKPISSEYMHFNVFGYGDEWYVVEDGDYTSETTSYTLASKIIQAVKAGIPVSAIVMNDSDESNGAVLKGSYAYENMVTLSATIDNQCHYINIKCNDDGTVTVTKGVNTILPTGGSVGDVLVKKSLLDGDAEWMSQNELKDTKTQIVYIAENTDGSYRASMTLAEVQTAINAGSYVIMRQQGNALVWTLNALNGSGSKLTFTRTYTDGNKLIVDSVKYTSNNVLNRTIETSLTLAANQNTCSIFRRVCCIGDSATAGHIDYGYASDGSLSTGVKLRRNEKYAWPAFMAKLTGNEYINLGISGATAKTWLDNAAFNPGAGTITVSAAWSDKDPVSEDLYSNGIFNATVEDTEYINAYLIGLGMNDTSNVSTDSEDAKLPLGSTEEIGGSAETFYGKYSELIEKIHSVSPWAHIFVQTMHDNMNDRRTEYNEAIKYIANYYSAREEDPIPVHVLDLYQYKDLYKVDSIINDKLGGHWTAISYQQFAEILRRIWSEYINTHVSEFKDVHLYEKEAWEV